MSENIFVELDQVGKDYMLQLQHTRLDKLANAIMTAIDILSPENVRSHGKTVTILNLRLMLDRAIDESLTDNQENLD